MACSCHSSPRPAAAQSCSRSLFCKLLDSFVGSRGLFFIIIMSSCISQLGFHSIQYQGAGKLMVPFPYSLVSSCQR